MVTIGEEGEITFELQEGAARSVEVVGAFEGWHEQHLPMRKERDGTWCLTIDPGPGTYLFRYRIDGHRWRLDDAAHGVGTASDGTRKSRVYRPDAGYRRSA